MAAEPTERRRRVPVGPRMLLAMLAAFAALIVGLLLVRGDGEPGPGPLETNAVDSLIFPVYAGRAFTYSQTVVLNRGKQPATLIAARPVRVTPGLEVLKTIVAGSRRLRTGIAGDRVFPPTFDKLTDLRALRGYRLAPTSAPDGRRGVELVFALRATKPGRFEFRGIELDYKIDGKRYHEILPNAFAACAARARLGKVSDCREAEIVAPAAENS